MGRRFRVGSLIGAMALVAVAGCSKDPSSERTVTFQQMNLLPFESLQDWRDYADAVVVVQVKGEKTSLADERYGELPEHPVDRVLNVAVEDTILAWPGRQIPKEFDLGTPGYIDSEKEGRREVVWESVGAIRTGDRFIVAMVETAGGVWMPQTGTSILRLDPDGGTITVGLGNPTAARLNGSRPDDVERQLTRLQVSEAALRYQELNGLERYSAVYAETHKKPPVKDGPEGGG